DNSSNMPSLDRIIKDIQPLDEEMMRKAQMHLDNLTKPQGSLGRLEELSKKVAGIKRDLKPKIKRKLIFTFASDHGIASRGVSAFPQEVTTQMVHNFLTGGAGINVLARHVGAKVRVVDVGVASELENEKLINKKISYGTKDFSFGLAMSREDAISSINIGIEVLERELEKGIDVVGAGDMGIGNTTPSSAILSVLSGKPAREICGRGTGIDDYVFERKISLIKKGIKINSPNPKDPIDVLSKVGGFEIGAITGLTLASAYHKIPVVLDGFISTAGALIAYKLSPQARDYMIASHLSSERGHALMLKIMNLKPLLDLNLRLGEGTGAALGIFILEASVKILTEMATFEGAQVSREVIS
ncbi:MAG: nicotinate-nucleotide--dimethylbenzimidazole phosphoribosyltransferase, partial [Candidatus Methanofastidiosia archaeon]